MRLNWQALFLLTAFGLVRLANATPLEHKASTHFVRIFRRQAGLDTVLGGWNDPGGQGQDQGTKDSDQDTLSPTKTFDSNAKPSIFDFFSTVLPTETGGRKENSAATTGPTSFSIIGSLPPLPTATTKTSTQKPSASSTSSSSNPSSSAAALASADSDDGSSQWKIIGVAVIAFSAVAAILLLAVFFDQWWRFVKDLIGRRRAKGQVEEIVPDWEKASWEVRFGDDRHRYPSFSSMPDKSSTQGLVRGRSIQSELQWKERAAEAIQHSPLSSSSGHPPSPRSGNRIPRSPTKMYTGNNSNTAPYPNSFEPPRSPAPQDVYGGME